MPDLPPQARGGEPGHVFSLLNFKPVYLKFEPVRGTDSVSKVLGVPHTCSLSGKKGHGNRAGRRRKYSSCSCFCSSSSSCSLFSCSFSPSTLSFSPVSQTPPLPLQPFIHRPSETFYMKLMYWASLALYLPHLYLLMNTKCRHCWKQGTELDVFC